jgi:hypothetical protein
MYDIVLTPEELRNIITGKALYRRCPSCQGEGESWTLHYTTYADPDNEQQREMSAQEAADFVQPPEYDWTELNLYDCDECNSVGYISNLEL